MARLFAGAIMGREEGDRVDEEELLLRRTPPGVPQFVTSRDALTGEVKISRGGLKVDEDGMSVYCNGILEENDMSAASVRKKPDQFVFCFSPVDVRVVEWDAVHSSYTDEPIGCAHASIVFAEMPPPKMEIERMRVAVMAAARVIVDPAA